MGALDELVARWRANPDAETTLALCSHLSVHRNVDLIREVGASAETWLRDDADVMLGIGRMYLDADLFAEAQAALVTAGKARPDDGRPFRFLGEVLLRRGDAVRAEKVLGRAIQLGQRDAETALWHDRAVVYVALQQRVGPQAVAGEVSRTIPKQTSIPPPTFAPSDDPFEDEATLPRGRLPAPVAPAPSFSPAVHAVPASPPTAPSFFAPSEPAPTPAPFGGSPMAGPSAAPFGGSPMAGPSAAPFGAPAAERVEGRRGSLPPPDAKPVLRFDDAPIPDAATILENLAAVGIFEPTGGAAPAWEAAPRTKARGTWVFGLATVLAVGAGGGGYAYARSVKAQRAAAAVALGDEVQGLLAGAKPGDLRATDEKLSRMFDLDSRSQRAAKLWLQNRVLGALLLPGDPVGIDNAIHRCKTLEVPEPEYVYGRIASFLAEGDLAGAAALLPKWDKVAGNDAMYQLAAGAVLERAGDDRALERYEAATKLDAGLLAAQLLFANAALLELGPEKAKPAVDAARKALGDRPASKALGALAWVLGDHAEALAASAKLTDAESAELPAPLATVPLFVEAVVAQSGGDHAKATLAIKKAIPLAYSPGMAVWLGFLALGSGDDALARTAALRALQFSAVYPRARVLASRVALVGGRLDDAKSAIDQLDPKSPEVAVVRAAAAYETLDTAELSDALASLGDAAKAGDLAALGASLGVATGREYPIAEARAVFARPSAPWGEIVALDAALDTGDLAGARALVDGMGAAAARPVHALRVARLLRYEGKAADAVKVSTAAFNQGTTTARSLIEHVYVLVANEQASHAKSLVAQYSNVLGPMSKWLATLVDAAAGRVAEANVRAAQLELPPDAAPFALKVLAARALAAAGDRRGKGYVADLRRIQSGHPDLKQAAETR